MNIRNITPRLTLFSLCLLLMPITGLSAPEISAPGSMSLTWENDLFSPSYTDRHYTNGLQVTKTSHNYNQFDSSNTFGWLAKAATILPVGKGDWLKRRATLSFGQVMQTPEDITVENPDVNDVPYGGILYAGHGLEAFSDQHADYLDIIIGVTGKYSLTEDTQKIIHKAIGAKPPQGWDSQVPSELLLNVSYSRRTANNLFESNGGWQFDWVNFGQVSLGNAQTDIQFGTGLAWHQASISPLAIRPGRLARDMVIATHGEEGRAAGWFSFGGVSAKLVAWDVLLDGTMFHDSPSVDKERLVYQAVVHAGYKWTGWSLHYSWVVSSPTFEREEGDPDHYGSLNISWAVK